MYTSLFVLVYDSTTRTPTSGTTSIRTSIALVVTRCCSPLVWGRICRLRSTSSGEPCAYRWIWGGARGLDLTRTSLRSLSLDVSRRLIFVFVSLASYLLYSYLPPSLRPLFYSTHDGVVVTSLVSALHLRQVAKRLDSPDRFFS